MRSLELQLPEELEAFVADQTESEGFACANDYIVAMLKTLQQTAWLKQVEPILKERVEALDRGEGQPMTEADWQEIRATFRANITEHLSPLIEH